MIVRPDMPDHPKVVLLRQQIGDIACELLLRLWGHAQANGACLGRVDAHYIKAITRYRGGADRLWKALVEARLPGKAGFLDLDEHGNVWVHDFEDFNSNLRANRHNGKAGGRPPVHGKETHGKPTGNPRVKEEGEGVEGVRKEGSNHPPLEVMVAHFQKHGGYSEDQVRLAVASYEATACDGVWMFGKRPVTDWRSALEARMGQPKKNGGAVSGVVGGGGMSVAQRVYVLDKEIEELEGQIMGFEDTQPELAERLMGDLKAKRDERASLSCGEAS